MFSRLRPYVAALALTATAAAGAHAQILSADFETDPSSTGWYFPLGISTITTDQAFSGTKSYHLTPNTYVFYSPQLTVYPQNQLLAVDYMSLDLTGTHRTDGPAHWAVTLNRPGTGWIANTLVSRAQSLPSERVAFLGSDLYLDDIRIRPISRAQAAQIQDANFAALMPQAFNYTAPGNRHNQLPGTFARLGAGQTLNVAMVGDSIIGDTFGTIFEGLVERRTGGTLNVTPFISGGAGSTYWAQENRIQGVMAGNPDLFIFGGISQHDIPSLRSVIQQARAVDPGIEILLMSPVAGIENNPFGDPSLAQPANPNGTDYRAQMMQLAAEFQGVQFWDLTSPWAQYILGSGLTYNDFLRDGVHMSARGQMLTGRILEAYFTPIPEPSSLLLAGLAGGAATAAWRRRKARATA